MIPSRSNAGIHIPHDPDIHAQRNLVERFFYRMKDMRRLTTGYEKLKRNFLSMVHIFAIRCWLNRAHTLVMSGNRLKNIAIVKHLLFNRIDRMQAVPHHIDAPSPIKVKIS